MFLSCGYAGNILTLDAAFRDTKKRMGLTDYSNSGSYHSQTGVLMSSFDTPWAVRFV
jgi:hypothetical protein